MVEVVRNWNLPSRITLMKARFLLASPVPLKVMVPVAPSTTTEDRAWRMAAGSVESAASMAFMAAR